MEYAPLNYSSKLADSHFREDYLSEHVKAYVDNLNLLYVAFTRAERELYVLPYAPKITKEGKPSDIGSNLLLCCTISWRQAGCRNGIPRIRA